MEKGVLIDRELLKKIMLVVGAGQTRLEIRQAIESAPEAVIPVKEADGLLWAYRRGNIAVSLEPECKYLVITKD